MPSRMFSMEEGRLPQEMKHGKAILPALLIFGLICIATVGLSLVRGTWDRLKPDACRFHDCFCEPFQTSLMIQPINTYSNLGLVLAGLAVGWTGSKRIFPVSYSNHSNLMTTRRACPAIYGSTLVAAGFGSMFYHASLSRAGEWTDLVGIYLFISFVLFYNLARLATVSHGILAGFYGATILISGLQMSVAPQLQQVVFGGLVTGALGIELAVRVRQRSPIRLRYLACALWCFGIGAALWAMNGTVLPCDTNQPVQWHAIWHLLTAVAAVLLYVYYLSEEDHVNPILH
jgi:hypothetical protein